MKNPAKLLRRAIENAKKASAEFHDALAAFVDAYEPIVGKPEYTPPMSGKRTCTECTGEIVRAYKHPETGAQICRSCWMKLTGFSPFKQTEKLRTNREKHLGIQREETVGIPKRRGRPPKIKVLDAAECSICGDTDDTVRIERLDVSVCRDPRKTCATQAYAKQRRNAQTEEKTDDFSEDF